MSTLRRKSDDKTNEAIAKGEEIYFLNKELESFRNNTRVQELEKNVKMTESRASQQF